MRGISDILDELNGSLNGERTSLAHILDIFHERGFGAILFILALPAALPVPAVGYGTILAIPLIFLTAQQALGARALWLPRRLKQKTIASAALKTTIAKAQPFIAWLEIVIRPRLGSITQGVFSNIIGLAGLIMALSVLIPLPLTNTVPSLGIALMALGVLMRDGLAVLAGMVIGLAWIALLGYFILTFGAEGIEMMKDMVKSIL